MNAAYEAAQPGDTITIPPGSYPAETLTGSKAVIVKAQGASFAGLLLSGVKNLTLDGVTVSGLFTMRASPLKGTVDGDAVLTENVTVTNADLKTFLFRNVRNVTLRDSQVGGQNVSTSGLGVPKVGGYPSSPYRPSSGVVLERVFFHDIIRTVTGDTHAECLFIDGGTDGVTIRGSSFTNCGVFDIFGGPSSAGPISNVTIEANLLDVPRDTVGGPAASAMNFKGGATNVVIRQNSILGNVRFDDASYPGRVMDNNAFSGFVSASEAPCDLSACYRNDLRVASGSGGVPGTSPPPTTTEPPPTSPPPPPPPSTTPPPAAPPTETQPPPPPPPADTQPAPACDNDLDDDKDGKIDLADPGCASHGDMDETDPASGDSGPGPSPEPPAATSPAEPRPEPSGPSTTTPRTLTLPTDVVLHRGNTGENVRALQEALTELGYAPGPVDGTFGPATEQAVIDFQKDEGLVADGVAGEKTLTALNGALARR